MPLSLEDSRFSQLMFSGAHCHHQSQSTSRALGYVSMSCRHSHGQKAKRHQPTKRSCDASPSQCTALLNSCSHIHSHININKIKNATNSSMIPFNQHQAFPSHVVSIHSSTEHCSPEIATDPDAIWCLPLFVCVLFKVFL